MSLPRRSQSALEYMMTYGWAILVIVIVAAVLYSLGIFSPSSSLSTTVTGFSNLGTVNAVCLGGTSFTISMGDSTGYPINITQINLTSSSGKTTYSPNILIQPNSIQTVTVPSSSLCSPGARYSVSAVISYLEPGQVFQGPYTSTGTVSGTAASPPSSATSYEPLNISNTQNQGTPSPFQQMINVTSSSPGWGDISSSPFGQNVEFFSATGQILDSWLENYTSTYAIWWVKLTSSIPAGSKQTIYMGFAPTSTNLLNVNNIGEASYLNNYTKNVSDINNVFLWGTDFIGKTLPVGVVVTDANYSIDNGLTYKARYPYNSFSVIYLDQVFPDNILVGFRENLFANFTNGNWVTTGFCNTTGFSHSQISGFTYGEVSEFSVSDILRNYSSWSGVLVNSDLSNKTNNFLISQTTNPPYTTWSVNGVTLGLTPVYSGFDPNQFISSPLPVFFEDAAGVPSGDSGTVPNPIKMYYYFVSKSPPNNIMPSISFGSVI